MFTNVDNIYKGVIAMLNEKLRQYRKAKGWTQDDLAERSGYSRSSIINWESGKRAPRTVDIDRLAIVLGVSPRELINDVSNTQSNETNQDTYPLPSGVGAGSTSETGYAYWGGVLDKSLKLAESKNLQEIKLVAPLLKLAYHALLQVIDSVHDSPQEVISEVSTYNGDNSNYTGNTLNLAKAIA